MTSEQSELCSDVVPVVGLRRRKLCIKRFASGGKAYSRRCGSFPHGNRFAGLPWVYMFILFLITIFPQLVLFLPNLIA